jgi:hypothetical protein
VGEDREEPGEAPDPEAESEREGAAEEDVAVGEELEVVLAAAAEVAVDRAGEEWVTGPAPGPVETASARHAGQRSLTSGGCPATR